MRQQLPQRDRFFPGLREFRPDLPHMTFDVDLVFLQDVQQTSASDPFRRRPNQNDRVSGPRLLASGIAKSAVKLDQLLSVLTDGNGGTELDKCIEIHSKQMFEALAKLIYIQYHRWML